MHSKKYRAIKERTGEAALGLSEAVSFVKEHPAAAFDETVELHINLGIDASKSDQVVRGSVQLPAGAAKQKRIAVFAAGQAEQKAAREAGASLVGGEELIKQVTDEKALSADIVVATPDMMPKIAAVARILGPLGLMPNPKTGTVTQNPAAVVAELQGGKLSFKMDQLGNIHEAVGKVSWNADKILANIEALLEAVNGARPASAKGQLVRSVTIKTTMGPAIRVGS